MTVLIFALRLASSLATIAYIRKLRRRVFLLERLAGGPGR